MAGANGDSRVQFITFIMEPPERARGEILFPVRAVAPNTPGADQDDSTLLLGGPSETLQPSRARILGVRPGPQGIGRFKFPENPTSSSRRSAVQPDQPVPAQSKDSPCLALLP